MRFSRWCGMTAAMLAAACLVGCGGGGDKGNTQNTGGGDSKGNTTKAGGKLTPIEAKETAVLKGRVTFDGTPPAERSFVGDDLFAKNDDKNHCLADPSKHSENDLTWLVSKDGGVANVAVWVLPGDGTYFKLPEKTKDLVSTDQPFCAFEPHVQLHFPGAPGGDRKLQSSGQKYEIHNSAKIAHNTNFAGDPVQGISGNYNLKPEEKRPIELPPSATEVVRLVCDRHKWMKGYVWSLPTPYAAVTDKDGNFTIEGIPAGAPVKVVFWHEGPGFFGTNGAKGEVVTLKAGDNPKDAKVKGK